MKEHKVFPGGDPLTGLDTPTACLILVSNLTQGVSYTRNEDGTSTWCVAHDPVPSLMARGFSWLREAGMIEETRPGADVTALRLTHRGRAALRKLFPGKDLILP